MKSMSKLALVTLALVAAGAAPALAFHDGGVARCNGCHTMHNSQNNAEMAYNAAGTGPAGLGTGNGYDDLLLFGNKTDVCLRCHGVAGRGYTVWGAGVTTPSTLHGAGDFVFQLEDDIMDDTRAASVTGIAAGHTLQSDIKGTVADTTLATAPGGAYPADDLWCTSCHDPHGTDSYRMLYRLGQTTVSDSGVTIAWSDLAATGIALSSTIGESDTNHAAYQSGYSEWCGQCHGDFHAASGNLVHPSGELLAARQVDVYNAYLGTTDCINNPPLAAGQVCGSGAQATAYKAAVPFEDAANVDIASTAGPTLGTSSVACMSCHRAHASSAPDSGRWDFNVRLLEEDGDHTASYAIPNPYPADLEQKSMCNKCHAQDEFDHLP